MIIPSGKNRKLDMAHYSSRLRAYPQRLLCVMEKEDRDAAKDHESGSL